MPPLFLNLLGSVTVRLEDETLDGFPTRSALALLVYLAENGPGVLHQREVLAEQLFPGLPPESSRQNLRQALYSLRRRIKNVQGKASGGVDLIDSARETIRLNPGADIRLDSAEFERHIRDGALEEAVDLYRGDFLQDFFLPDNAFFEDWIGKRRQHYRSLFTGCLESLVSQNRLRDDFETAVQFGRRLVDQDPLREASARTLMRILMECGERAQALRLFERLQDDLQKELGVLPEAETTALYEAIAKGDIPSNSPPAVERTAPHVILPVVPTAFFGRLSEIKEIRQLCQAPGTRLVTLLGPGGTGKTRLSVQTAREMAAAYPDGVYFVALQPVNTAEELVTAVLKALDIPFYQTDEAPREIVLDYLASKSLLLVLDNFEQLVDVGGSALVAEILRRAPDVTVLVSSRARLNLQGEHLYPVGGLEVPTPEEAALCESVLELASTYSAVQLFADRAALVHPGFALSGEISLEVIEICRLVNGLPLGIELAATWVELLSPNEIIKEIRRSLDFLEADLQDLPERQRSLRAVFESSWRMLGEPEREALLRLSVFPGQFSREAATHVSGAGLRTLLGLRNKSWLQHPRDGYFGIHTLLQHYVRDLLRQQPAEERAALEQMGQYYADFLERRFEQIRSPDQRLALDAIEAEFDNIRSAFRWFVLQKEYGVLARRMLPALHWFAFIREYLDDLVELCTASLPEDLDPEARPDVDTLILRIVANWERGQYITWDALQQKDRTKIWNLVKVHSLVETLGPWYMYLVMMHYIPGGHEAIDILEADMPRMKAAFSAWWYGHAGLVLARMFSARGGRNWRHWVEEALESFTRQGGPYERAMALQMLVDADGYAGDFASAEAKLEQALALVRYVGAPYLEQELLDTRSNLYRLQGRYEEAFESDRAIRLFFKRIGAKRRLHETLIYESLHQSRYGSLAEAFALRREALALNDPTVLPAEYAWNVWELGELYRLSGDLETARTHYDQAEELFLKYQIYLGIGYTHRAKGLLAFLAGEFKKAQSQFQNMLNYTANHRWSEAYGLSYLGRTAVGLAQADQAEWGLRRGMSVAHGSGYGDLVSIAILGFAELAAQKEDWLRVVELASAVVNDFNTWHETREEAKEVIETASGHFDPEAVDRAVERGKALSFEELVRLVEG